MRPVLVVLTGLCLVAAHAAIAVALAQTPDPHLHQPQAHSPGERARQAYAGQQRRQIKSLSERDIDDLINGRGWGLAKAAELNGLPGPAHVLELRSQLHLTEGQAEAIKNLFETMKRQAIPIGIKLVALERHLDDGFAKGQMTRPLLRKTLAKIAQTLSELRFVHLSVHLETIIHLTPHQVRTYNRLRGYQNPEPDGKAPGHGRHKH